MGIVVERARFSIFDQVVTAIWTTNRKLNFFEAEVLNFPFERNKFIIHHQN